MNPILPRYDHAERGMSRLTQRPMIPHTWKKTTSTSRTAHKSILVVNMARQAPSLGPVCEERRGKGKSRRDIALPIERQGKKAFSVPNPCNGTGTRADPAIQLENLRKKTIGATFFLGVWNFLQRSFLQSVRAQPTRTQTAADRPGFGPPCTSPVAVETRRAACSGGKTRPAWAPRTGWHGRIIRVNPWLMLSSAGSCCPWA